MGKKYFRLNYCRICKNKNLKQIINLGSTPPANAFLKKTQLKSKEFFFPLKMNFCKRCGQLQLSHVVSPKLLFQDYVYVSSTSPIFIAHFEEYAKSLHKRLKLNKKSLVVDLGSNDGILLKPFKKLGVRVLGIDPAVKIAKKATKEGIETLPFFFNTKLAKKILKKYKPADIITANNVFAHIHDIDEIVEGVRILLKEDGVFVIEAPYLIDFVEKNYFDLIYHEHLSYFSVKSLRNLFKLHNMEIFDVIKVDAHGGSARYFIKRKNAKHKITKSVEDFLIKEKKAKLHNVKTYLSYSKKIDDNKKSLKNLISSLKKEKKSIAGYGAPAKGNTLLNYFKIKNNEIKYIIDDSPYKQGLYTPGTHIPVVSSSILEKDMPDYIFILAWNFAQPIMKKLENFRKKGGKFIIPVPKPKVI